MVLSLPFLSIGQPAHGWGRGCKGLSGSTCHHRLRADDLANVGVGRKALSKQVHLLLEILESLQFPSAVLLDAVGRRNAQMSAKERKGAQKSAKERKRAQPRKSAKERKRAQKGAKGAKAKKSAKSVSV